jgi:single-stranded DNA-binding protein
MADDYKKYDSQIELNWWNMRLAKDPQIIEGGEKPMVKLTAVATSRSERHSDMWLEIVVTDRQSDLAAYMKKGDKLGYKGGFLALRRWGDNNEKFSLELVRGELCVDVDLFVELKERGFTPGATGKGGKAPAKKAAPKRKVQSLDDDDLPGEGA